MADAEHCLAMAAEAERLAAIVSYARDKTRLREQAQTWREKAEAVEAERSLKGASSEAAAAGARGSMIGWLRRRSA